MIGMIGSTHMKVHRKRADPSGDQESQAVNRPKGGLKKKLYAAMDERCQAQSLMLTAANHADAVYVPVLLESSTAEVILTTKPMIAMFCESSLLARAWKPASHPGSTRMARAA
jgi:hypothetical protein